MHRPWSNTRRWLAACLAATAVSGPVPILAAPVQGEMVTEETPTTYRLPLIGLCDPDEEARVTGQPPTPVAPPTTADVPASAAPLPFHTGSSLNTQLLPAVQRAYNLAQRGAYFAARTEFIQILRRVAQSKDAVAGTDEFSSALAAGLRAMDEAEDFVPSGAQLEGEMDVLAIASSHRTPVLKDHEGAILPQEAVSLYHMFAQERLAHATVDEQSGSMALHGLGKVYARLGERQDDDVQCMRSAMTMYCAALDACPNNNMAANELGVLLCRTGHPTEAAETFKRAIDVAPTATAYHNLAVAQQKLGQVAQSSVNEQESLRLAALERSVGATSKRAGIQWVSPDEMSRVLQPAPLTAAANDPAIANRPNQPPQHRWR
jgi:tetratricopeptide (TPR) repeat protein